MSIETQALSWATVDLANDADVAELEREMLKVAGERIRGSVKRSRELGIVDGDGNLIPTEISSDMQEKADTDFGG